MRRDKLRVAVAGGCGDWAGDIRMPTRTIPAQS